MEAKRINNIELRNINGRWEIIKWYPNPYYGKKESYIWDEIKQAYRDPNCDCWYISPGCFTNPENCYVVADVENCDNSEPDIRTIMARPFQLSHNDRLDFYKIIKHIYTYDVSL